MSKFKPVKYESEGYRLEVFGVLLEADQPEEAIARYQKGEITFWNCWRGAFCGVLQDTKAGITLLFNDHIGSQMCFYTQTDKGIEWNTDLFALAQSTGTRAINEHFLWQLLLYGYSPVGETVFRAIHRLQAGEYLYIQGKQAEKRIYHRFDNTPNNLSIEQNIERIDAAFRKAVARALRFNEANGYTHFLPLSAGLDSRMTCCVANELAQTPLHHITYSQSGFYDETTPRAITDYWHNTLHFTPLDGGECLQLLDEASRLTQGLVSYSGAAQTLFGLPEIAKEQGGIFLTGMVGDIIVGTAYTECRAGQPYHAGEGALVSGHSDRLRQVLPADFEQLYANRELFYLYTRGFSCANLGSPLVHQAYGASYSPFCDVDVLEAAYAAPVEQRWNHSLYDQWIMRKYPEMAQWKHNGLYTIGQRPKMVSLCGRSMPLEDLPKRAVWFLLKRLHIHDFYQQKAGQTMNPEDDWLAENETLRTWAETYLQTHISLLDAFPELQSTALRLSNGTALERLQVLSLLACLRQALTLVPAK